VSAEADRTTTENEAEQPPAQTSEQPPAPPKKKGRLRFLRELPVLILVAFVLALLIKTFLLQAFYIPSESMDPTLKVGDRVLVEKILKTPSRDWIVVFRNPHPAAEPHRGWWSGFWHWLGEGFGISTPPDEDFIKRVIGLPGETIQIKQGVVFVDGRRLHEPYVSPVKDTTTNFGPCRVPRDRVFVMGDNRTDSNDSRFDFGIGPAISHGRCVGAIEESSIVGRAVFKIWPPSRFGLLH
jgi:signal peptidase I